MWGVIKKFALVLLALIGAAAVYLSLPLTSVAVLTVTASDQNGQKVTSHAAATYFDAQGTPIAKITPHTKGSWDNNLHWWTHSSHSASNLKPADAKRVASVKVEALDCDALTLPVTLERSYEPMGITPHGGGPAYFIYRFERSVVLQCR